MTTITFDTLALVAKLKAANFSQEQAEAVVRVIADAQDQIVTREYLDNRLQQELNPIKTDLAVLKWMMGMLLAGMLSLLLKAFF
jgi:pheromone shutdown protein TraB